MYRNKASISIKKRQQQQSAAQQTNLSGVLLQGNYLFYPFRRGSGIGFQRDIVNQTTQKLIRLYQRWTAERTVSHKNKANNSLDRNSQTMMSDDEVRNATITKKLHC